MIYIVVISSLARDRLRNLPPELTSFVLDHLDNKLARDPVRLSERASFAYPSGQAYYCDRVLGDQHWDFVIYFRYSQDEEHLLIADIDSIAQREV
jgi:hypothetical protein